MQVPTKTIYRLASKRVAGKIASVGRRFASGPTSSSAGSRPIPSAADG
jgi:hypothetical protein